MFNAKCSKRHDSGKHHREKNDPARFQFTTARRNPEN
jgi:hypothetical protein